MHCLQRINFPVVFLTHFTLQVIRTLKNVTIGEGSIPRPVSPAPSHSPKPGRQGSGQLSPDYENSDMTNLVHHSPRLSNSRRDLHSPVPSLNQTPRHTISSPTQTPQHHIISSPSMENGVDAETKPVSSQAGNNRMQKGLENTCRHVDECRNGSTMIVIISITSIST